MIDELNFIIGHGFPIKAFGNDIKERNVGWAERSPIQGNYKRCTQVPTLQNY